MTLYFVVRTARVRVVEVVSGPLVVVVILDRGDFESKITVYG
jgi:hypothetical protein